MFIHTTLGSITLTTLNSLVHKSHLLMSTFTNDTDNVRWEPYLTKILLLKTTNYIQYEIP